jgi:hypothetical protein
MEMEQRIDTAPVAYLAEIEWPLPNRSWNVTASAVARTTEGAITLLGRRLQDWWPTLDLIPGDDGRWGDGVQRTLAHPAGDAVDCVAVAPTAGAARQVALFNLVSAGFALQISVDAGDWHRSLRQAVSARPGAVGPELLRRHRLHLLTTSAPLGVRVAGAAGIARICALYPELQLTPWSLTAPPSTAGEAAAVRKALAAR